MSDYGTTPPPPPPGSGDGGYGGGYAAPPPVGGPVGGPPDNKLVMVHPRDHLLAAFPVGIVAIIKSAEVNSKWNSGDAAGAHQSAADAAKWIKWAVIAGVVSAVLSVVAWFLFVVALGAASTTSGM